MSTKLASQIERHVEGLLRQSKSLETGSRGAIRTVVLEDDVVAIKTALDDAPPNMVRNEAKYNETANNVDVGPELYYFDDKRDVLFREFIAGYHFDDWLRYQVLMDNSVRETLRRIYEQCFRLDQRGLHRPELSRPHDDIIITEEPVIIDFERCGFRQHPTNVLHFTECLLRKRYASLLGVNDRDDKKKALRDVCRAYKEGGGKPVFRRLHSTVLRWVTG
jgi:predicted Ser/Thr protein kinase